MAVAILLGGVHYAGRVAIELARAKGEEQRALMRVRFDKR